MSGKRDPAAKREQNFSVVNAFTMHFWRKTIDFLVYVYFAIVVAMWLAQDIPALQFRVFSYTTNRYGANRDYCSLAPLTLILENNVDFQTGVQELFTASFPDDALIFPTDQDKLEALILKAADLPVVANSAFFDIIGKSYCFGAEHYAVANNMPETPDGVTSDIWTQVRINKDIIYPSADYEPHTGRLVLIYTLALWIYILCRIGNEIYMLVVYWRYEKGTTEKEKFQPVFYHALWASLLPVCINSAVLIMIALKISGTCLTTNSSIYIMFALHMLATFLQYLPMLMLQYLKVKSKFNDKATPFTGDAEVTISAGSNLQITAKFQEPQPVSHFMTVYYYIIVAIMVQIATLYASGEIPEIHYSIFNANCEAGTLHDCIDTDTGGSTSSSNANYILLFAAPVLLRLIWAIGYFTYFCCIVDNTGMVTSKHYWATCTKDQIAVELQANVAAITEWRLKRPNANVKGMRLTYGTLIRQTVSTARMRLLLVGRFLIPMVAIFIAILFGILKLSEFIVWHGFPWWGIGIIVVSAIFLSLTIELVPVMMNRLQKAVNKAKDPSIA